MAELVALMDLGSNAARFLLASLHPGWGFRILEEQRVQTRLGSSRSGLLPSAAVEETTQALRRFLRRVSNGHRPRVLAIATSAVREAPNRARLLLALRDRDGIDVRVLTGTEEARLGAQAALRSLPIRDGLVADLGGGSLQLTRIRDAHIVGAASVPLGAVRLTRRFLHHDPPTPRELRALREEIRGQSAGVLPAVGPEDRLVVIGGTVRTLARMHLRARGIERRSRQGLRLQQSDLTAIREKLQALSARQRRRLAGLKAERADIILAGAIVLEELMVLGGHLFLTVCTVGVRDGVLWREAQRLPISARSPRAT
jgi:exopolyphosphatase/guanosine-5'-triphosphate,3'-diphosphate pyrophosphatase